jgi:hypothetical protein
VEQLKSKKRFKQDVKLAKLDRQVVFNFAKGKLPLTASAFDTLMSISRYVDMDGKINADFNEIRIELNQPEITLYRNIKLLLELGLVKKVNNAYFSCFHILTDGKDLQGLAYQRLMEEYLSPTVLNYSLNLKRFYYYFQSFSYPGFWKRVTVENLYQNTFHDQDYGVKYFESYKDMTVALFTLIKNSHIELKIGSQLLNANTPNYESIFHQYCGFDPDGQKRKERTSHKRKHKIDVRVFAKKELMITNRSSLNELEMMADTYDICHDYISDEMKGYIVGVKNELSLELGINIGVEIYRKALNQYLKSNHESVLYHAISKGKTADYIRDNIFKELEIIILDAAKVQNLNLPEYQISGLTLTNEQLNQIINFYMCNASENHLVLLDESLELQNTPLFKFQSSDIDRESNIQNPWEVLNTQIKNVYRKYPVNSDTSTIVNWKKEIRAWAKKGVLTSQELANREIERLKEKVYFFNSNRIRKTILIPNKKTDSQELPIYNWLE